MPTGYDKMLDQIARVKRAIPAIMTIAGETARGEMLERIFTNGQASNGSKIGDYSTRPMLVGFKSFINAGPARAFFAEKPRWVTVQTQRGPRRLAIMQGGYKELRQREGRVTAFVNLRREGRLERSIQPVAAPDGYGWGFINAFDAMKAGTMEKYYQKPIFDFSEAEQQTVTDVINYELARILD